MRLSPAAAGALGAISIACVFALYPAPANAQHQCADGPGPGETLAYRTPDSNGLAGVSFCWYVDDGQQQRQQRQPTPHPSEALAAAMPAFNAMIAQMAQALDNPALSDPRMIQLRNGYWKNYQEGRPPVPGQKCAATFANLDGLFTLAGTGSKSDEALLLFVGPKVPRPRQPVLTRVTLKQSGSEAQTVSVINQTEPGSKMGLIVFRVPDLKSGVGGIAAKSDIEISMNGKPIYQIAYHNGTTARAQLERCARIR